MEIQFVNLNNSGPVFQRVLTTSRPNSNFISSKLSLNCNLILKVCLIVPRWVPTNLCFLLQLLHKHQLLLGAESKTNPCPQPSCDWKTAYLQKCKCAHVYWQLLPWCMWCTKVTILCVTDFLNTCLQLINELGAVDARLAPQFRKLLAGEEKDKATSRPAEGKKVRASIKKDTVRSF